ncbi:MAG: protein phosphatase 2C domain-containing protein [Acidimicrobiia bacterium]|nr:protein phosphatase 2C domain-containing protein [Acidimicrobiia bacterium]
MECPRCSEVAPVGAKWCEACGADLSAEPQLPCVSCGDRDISYDGYCMSCGHKQPEERDHMVFEAGATVAITDRGLRHRHNEDAAAVGQLPGGGAVLVVCDGVSSTPGSAEASLAAATAARDLLIERLGSSNGASGGSGPTLSDGPSPTGTGAGDRIAEALVASAEVAQAMAAASPEVVSNAPHSQGGPPSSTFVAAIGRPVDGGTEVSVAWLGDSRAYWIEGADAVQLTADHELRGSLTRWLGADSLDTHPDVARHRSRGAGRLLLCSDGLWRYADPPVELAALVGRLESDHTTTRALADALVAHAVSRGGHDNITVALWAPTTDAGSGQQQRTHQRRADAGGGRAGVQERGRVDE